MREPATCAPNLVFVFPDQFRLQSMGFWSQPEFAGLLRGRGDPVVTPNLDAFARESLVLTRATSTAPVCSPFRAMLFSGRYPEANGVPHNCGHDRPDCFLRPELPCLTDVLAGAGYDCGYIGKWHLDFPHTFDPARPDWYPGGWDVYTPPERRHGCSFWHSYGTFDVHKDPHYWDHDGNRVDPARWSPLYEADVACDYIRNTGGQRRGERPFALFVGMNPPHTPNASLDDCEEEDFGHYADRNLRELLDRPNVSWEGDGLKYVDQLGTEAAPYYFAQVTGVDRAFGRILDAVDAAGLGDETIVVFTADHGEMLCSHGRRGKNRIWTECFDIPFLLRYPRTVRPRSDDLLLTPVDIMPTLLGLMGLAGSTPPGLSGADYSLLRCGAGPVPARPISAPFVRNAPGPQDAAGMRRGYVPAARGVKTHRYTYVVEDIDTGDPRAVLFDDEADPYQVRPLDPGRHPALARRLVDELEAHCRAMADPWRPSESPGRGVRADLSRETPVAGGRT